MAAVQTERWAAVREALAKVREARSRISDETNFLNFAAEVMIELAARIELFPARHFPPGTAAGGGMYRLNEDPDHGYALYVSSEMPGFRSKPHNHTTWVVIAGIQGCEHNDLYERIDDGSKPGWGELREEWGMNVTAGNALRLKGHDFHAIEITGNVQALHLHLYGRGLEHLSRRIAIDSPEGGAFRPIPPDTEIAAPVILADELEALRRSGALFQRLQVGPGGAADTPASPTELTVLVGDAEPCRLAARRLMRAGFANLSVLAP